MSIEYLSFAKDRPSEFLELLCIRRFGGEHESGYVYHISKVLLTSGQICRKWSTWRYRCRCRFCGLGLWR